MKHLLKTLKKLMNEHFNDAHDAHDTVDESDGSYDDRGHGQAMNF
jgi:hypothetical protein